MSILLVDDDSELVSIVNRHLERAGYRVLTAANGAEAVSLLERIPAPALIIVDLEMPILDGFGVLAALRRRPALGRCAVIVASSAPPNVIARRRAELGRARVVRKPMDLDALLDMIECPDQASMVANWEQSVGVGRLARSG